MTAEPLMAGKKGLIMGLANDKSIAWGIAQALDAQGAQIAISYQNEALEKRVVPLAEKLSFAPTLIKCDVTDSASVEACFKELGEKWGKIDFVVHAIAFSDKDQLKAAPLTRRWKTSPTRCTFPATRFWKPAAALLRI